MIYKGMNNKLRRTIIPVIIILLLLNSAHSGAAAPSETPEAVYTGDEAASAVIRNLDYTDVRNSNTWAKDAIYEAGALGIINGYGERERTFGRIRTLSKEEAIAIAYRAAGREGEAQLAAEALDNARLEGDKKTDALSMWSDGYLQLAARDGLISRQELNEALQPPEEGEEIQFDRTAPAQRQEMAFWLARTLNLEPVYGQQNVLSSFNDWRDADPVKIPYIEAVLRNGIMNGDSNGYLRPAQTLTREQAAQIVANAEEFILQAFNLEKKTGTVESILPERDYSGPGGYIRSTFGIRNSSGALHNIVTESASGAPDARRNEQSGNIIPARRELVVYKDGAIGDSNLLSLGDRIEYIVSQDNTVKYVKVMPKGFDISYVAVRINGVDTANSIISVTRLFELDNPDIEAAGDIYFGRGSEQVNASYKYSGSVSVTIDNRREDISGLQPGAHAVLTIQNDSVVTAVRMVDFGINDGDRSVVRGIVEDNNTQLGYITIFNEDGTGYRPEDDFQLTVLRTYYYSVFDGIEVFKNHGKAEIEDIEAGDTAFIRLDDDGRIISISAADNYTVEYGRVLSRAPGSMLVQYDDGTQQRLSIGSGVIVVADRKVTGYSRIKDGDRVRLIIHRTSEFTTVKEITIEGSEHFIAHIYKGVVTSLDDMSGKLVAQNLEVFDRGVWRKHDNKGFTDIRLAEGYDIFFEGNRLDIRRANRYFGNSEAYIAVEKDYGGEERAVVISFRNEDDTEVIYSDSVSDANPGGGRFSLGSRYGSIEFSDGSIVIKDGRLVSGRSISPDDVAYVVANRSYETGRLNAGIVEISERQGAGFLQIYRARIKDINEGEDFTVESFSELTDHGWDYANTPKTFNIRPGTRILGENGVINQRSFSDYGENSFIGRTVYILADGLNAVLLSTAPYGTYSVKGRIYRMTEGGADDEEGPQGFILRSVRLYDNEEHIWNAADDMEISILKNSIILKGNKAADASELRKGDSVRLIKRGDSETGDAYIIIVEE